MVVSIKHLACVSVAIINNINKEGNVQKYIIFDIETIPAPDSELIKPEFVANKTLKDPVKIASDLADKEAEWRSKLALDATTCRIAIIGILRNRDILISDGNEADILQSAWSEIAAKLSLNEPVIGFNSNGFDLPVMIRRSWKLGVKVPAIIRHGRYWNEGLIDLMEVWTCGKREQTISLKNLCKFLGVGQKSGNGADFGNLTPEQQKEYLLIDLKLTQACAERLLP